MEQTIVLMKMDINKVCRICETKENLVDLSTEEYSHLNEKLHKIADFEKNKYSSYLKFICVPCSSKVETTYDFKTQCEKTYTKLINKVKDYFESESADSEIPCDSYDWLYIAVESPRSDDGLNETDKENINETINKKYFGRTYAKKNINLPKVRNDVEDSNLNDKSKIEDEDINKSINLPEVRNDVEDNDLNDKNKIEDEDINKSINLPEVRNDVEDNDLNDKSEIEEEEYMEKSYSELFQVVETYDPSEYKNIKLPDIDEIWPELINQSKGRIFECAHCDKAFKHRVRIERHIESVHLKIKPFVCEFCGKRYAHMTSYTAHRDYHTTGTSKQYPSRLLRKLLVRKNRGDLQLGRFEQLNSKHTDRAYLCDVCGYQCLTETQHKDHQNIHLNLKPYSCKECQKRFYSKIQYQIHNHFTHKVGKHFPCYHCEKIFTTKFNLKQHILIHTEIKDHTCTCCRKSFSSAVNLRMHERIHTGIKYECAKCWKTYVHKRSLQRHLKQCVSSKKTKKKKQIKKMNNTKRNETIEE
ncbi:zinc finger protein 583-like isoform X1 [Phlebotomus papatasi]|uniref:zinc finger protein 583-like isoform X1 n=1 Tax=Phlebotomus papatasi TaxID=29031 RepID=UPI0024836BA5|nr:zinc finger protein 583-like isoform X1 [Phlebotomus papatasi]